MPKFLDTPQWYNEDGVLVEAISSIDSGLYYGKFQGTINGNYEGWLALIITKRYYDVLYQETGDLKSIVNFAKALYERDDFASEGYELPVWGCFTKTGNLYLAIYVRGSSRSLEVGLVNLSSETFKIIEEEWTSGGTFKWIDTK